MPEIVSPARPVLARLATTAAFLAAGIGTGAWAASIPIIKARLGLSDAALGMALFAFAGGAICSMPPTGWLLSRQPSHRIMTGAAAVFACLLLLPALAPSLPALVGAALVLGATQGVLDVSMNAYATIVQKRWGRPIMSSFHAAFSIGGLIGAALMGAILAQGRGIAFGLALMAAAAGALALIAGVSSRPFEEASGVPASLGFARPRGILIGLGALAFLTLLIEGAMADWSGVFLASIGKAPPGIAATGYAAFSVAMAAGRIAGDRLVHRFGSASVLQLGAALTALGLTLAIADPEPMAALIGFAMVGLGAANVIPLLFGAGGQAPGTPAGVGVAMVATLGYAGFLSGPPLIGLLADVVGLRAALCVLPFSAIIVAVAAARIIAIVEDRRGARYFRRPPAPADRERAPAAD